MRILTLSREFGSGGRTIGKAVAEKLNYPYYDHELIEEIAKKSGYAPAYIEKTGEETSYNNSFLYNLFMHARLGGGKISSVEGQLFIEQFKMIKELAEKGPCVIVGRCSDYVLKDREDCMHVHIHAPKAFRADRIVQVYGETDDAPKKRIEDKDKKRKNYYEYYTGQKWGDVKNYHLCLNSGFLGIDESVALLVQAMGQK